MKNLVSMLVLVILFVSTIACKKSSESLPNQVSGVVEEIIAPCPNCNGGGLNLSDAELQAMGINVGCQLAKANNMAPVGSSNAIYTTYVNTTSSSFNAPQIYKDGVQTGWYDCFYTGQPVDACATYINIVNSSGQFQSMTMCQWWSNQGLPIYQ